MSANSDTKYPSQKATKTYSDTKISKTTSGEISAMTEKTTPASADVVVIEDSADSYSKKKAQIGNIKSSFGSWVDKSSDYGAQQATTDGFVIATNCWGSNSGGRSVYGYSDSSNPPTTERGRIYTNSGTTELNLSFMFPVRKNDYWKITATNNSSMKVYWLPYGV